MLSLRILLDITWRILAIWFGQELHVPNGNISAQINVGRGCRQGDPIAGYLLSKSTHQTKSPHENQNP